MNKEDLNFEDLVSNYYQPLYRYGYSLAKTEHEAKDLVQQTFCTYAEKGDSLRDPSKIKSWLFTTLYREFISRIRKNKRIDHYEPEILEATAGSTESTARRSADSSRILESLEKVDTNYRQPLTLFYMKNLSYKEVAEILDLPIGTVMSRLSRGKAQLRDIFEGTASETI